MATWSLDYVTWEKVQLTAAMKIELNTVIIQQIEFVDNEKVVVTA